MGLLAGPRGALADDVLVEVRGVDAPVRVPRALVEAASTRPSQGIAAPALQFAAGAGTTLVLSGVALGMALCECAESDARPLLVLAAVPVATSAVVFGVGRAFDGRQGGSFGPTLLGGALGTAAGIGVLAASKGDSTPVVLGALAAPAIGAMVGYRASRPSPSLLHVAARGGSADASWGVPLPTPRVVELPGARTSVGVQLDLVDLSF
jgi:hypothetical protein